MDDFKNNFSTSYYIKMLNLFWNTRIVLTYEFSNNSYEIYEILRNRELKWGAIPRHNSCIIIISQDINTLIDEIKYSEDYHF